MSHSSVVMLPAIPLYVGPEAISHSPMTVDYVGGEATSRSPMTVRYVGGEVTSHSPISVRYVGDEANRLLFAFGADLMRIAISVNRHFGKL